MAWILREELTYNFHTLQLFTTTLIVRHSKCSEKFYMLIGVDSVTRTHTWKLVWNRTQICMPGLASFFLGHGSNTRNPTWIRSTGSAKNK